MQTPFKRGDVIKCNCGRCDGVGVVAKVTDGTIYVNWISIRSDAGIDAAIQERYGIDTPGMKRLEIITHANCE